MIDKTGYIGAEEAKRDTTGFLEQTGRIIGLAVVLALCGCAGIVTRQQQIAATCAGADAALKVAVVAAKQGKLTEGQIMAISRAVAVIWPEPPAPPLCNADAPPTLSDFELSALYQAAAVIRQGGAP